MQICLCQINFNHLTRPKEEGFREQVSLVQGREPESRVIFRAEDVTLEKSHNIPSSDPRNNCLAGRGRERGGNKRAEERKEKREEEGKIHAGKSLEKSC